MKKVKNAIILAAGRSFSFAPFSYELPKALFKVKGETLIERQIKQLKEAGVDNIAVVIGHMREKMFYLEQKHGVTIIANPVYASTCSVYSLYLAKDFLEDSFVCACDNYYPENIFLQHEDSAKSYHQLVRFNPEEKEIGAEIDADGKITKICINKATSYSVAGYAYFNKETADAFICKYEEARTGFSATRFFWEEFLGQNLDDIPMYGKVFERSQILEFDTVEEVRKFDPDLIENLNSNIARNICEILKCEKNDIKNIKAIAKGLTNVSFIFEVKGNKYVYRHPGGTSSNFVSRPSEHFSQNLALRIGIDGTLVYIHPTDGWKISRYVEGTYDFDYSDKEAFRQILQKIRKLHTCGEKSIYEFDILKGADHLLNEACKVNSSLREEFGELRAKVIRLHHFTEADNVPKCVCHNDCYYPNFLVSPKEIHLIDWEFTGMGDPANDFAAIVSRDEFSTLEEMEPVLEMYFGRKPTPFEHRHYFAYVPINAWYYFCWSLFKDSVNESNGYFMHNTYRKCTGMIDQMLNEYTSKLEA